MILVSSVAGINRNAEMAQRLYHFLENGALVEYINGGNNLLVPQKYKIRLTYSHTPTRIHIHILVSPIDENLRLRIVSINSSSISSFRRYNIPDGAILVVI